MNDHVWVSGEPGELTIALDRLGVMAPLRLHAATISLRLGSEAPAPQSGIEGVISGVIDAEEYTADLLRMAHAANATTCDNSWGIPPDLGVASDIMLDGSQVPGSTCDGMSVGLGFEARAIRLGQALDEQPIEPDPCAR